MKELGNVRCELVSGEDVSFLEGRLKTLVDATGLADKQSKAIKDQVNTILWDWFNFITDYRTDHKIEKKDWYAENKIKKDCMWENLLTPPKISN